MMDSIVITGIGLVTPLGNDPSQVLRRLEAGDHSAIKPTEFAPGRFACPVRASISDFRPQDHVREAKSVRLMNRESQLAVAAARIALHDADLEMARFYGAENVGIYAATGLAGLPLAEVAPLIKASIKPDGEFDAGQFGTAGLRAVSPVLSFKILGNMPACFAAINEGIKGPNAIYTPWEGQGAQAIESGVRALRNGRARCVLVGGCEVKTHELAFLSLEQHGIFESWRTSGKGPIPSEGAVFLVMETEPAARTRGARIYARLAALGLCTKRSSTNPVEVFKAAISRASGAHRHFRTLLSSSHGSHRQPQDETVALVSAGIAYDQILAPKQLVGDLFAAAAALQTALAAFSVHESGGRALALCFGHGSEQAAFALESA